MLWSVGACHGKYIAYQPLRCVRCPISLVILCICSQFKAFSKAICFLQIKKKKKIESRLFLHMRKIQYPLVIYVFSVFKGCN